MTNQHTTEHRTTSLVVRLTRDERAAVEEAAKAAGYTLARYVRSRLFLYVTSTTTEEERR